ncbi:MAG: ribosome small subunit-dependent GTPase A [Bacteroides sp.]|nr:ribosome small subunit-dependent GTPase A [Prevotella sp.]MCM1407519.1 ribosome small subunit-dependent GTPase A [Treponema brennaborense]MCM1470009.1 ribosome small subunit-dependent GTPase A [Bacteroides sp.]
MLGTVLGGSNNVFDVECSDGITRQCTLKGKKLKTERLYYNPLAPGDKVSVEPDSETETAGRIIALEPRKNEFTRWNIKGRAMQLLAANLDRILIVTTPDEPPFRPRFVDRALARAEKAGLTPVVVCNKCDTRAAQNPVFEARAADWERIGYEVIRMSARTGEGVTQLAALLENRLCAFFGQSGVGKSSIINVLDSDCVLKTGSLSEKYGRGTHTTVKGTLLRLTLNEALVGGRIGVSASIIDTPGVRRFILHDIAAQDLALYFREMKPLLGKCAFGMSCTHTHEDGCEILAAVRDGRIGAERYDSYLRIRTEITRGTWED